MNSNGLLYQGMNDVVFRLEVIDRAFSPKIR